MKSQKTAVLVIIFLAALVIVSSFTFYHLGALRTEVRNAKEVTEIPSTEVMETLNLQYINEKTLEKLQQS